MKKAKEEDKEEEEEEEEGEGESVNHRQGAAEMEAVVNVCCFHIDKNICSPSDNWARSTSIFKFH